MEIFNNFSNIYENIEAQIESLSKLISDEYDSTIKKMKETEDIGERKRLLEYFFDNVLIYDKGSDIDRVFRCNDECDCSSVNPKEYTSVDNVGNENEFTIDYEKMTELNDGYELFIEWIQFYGKPTDRAN